jgi:hypothetical protein
MISGGAASPTIIEWVLFQWNVHFPMEWALSNSHKKSVRYKDLDTFSKKKYCIIFPCYRQKFFCC